MGHVCVLGGSPNVSSQAQNIFVRVPSWTWISRPMTGSKSATRHAPVKADRMLERVGGVQQPVLAERRAGELEPAREPIDEPVRDRDARDAGQRHRDRAVV